MQGLSLENVNILIMDRDLKVNCDLSPKYGPASRLGIPKWSISVS